MILARFFSDFRPSHNDQIVSTAMVHENSDANASDRLLYEEVGAGKTKSAEEIVPSNGSKARRVSCSRRTPTSGPEIFMA